MGYDSAGRTNHVIIARGVYTYTYDGPTGNLKSITAPDGGLLSASYDGFVPLGQSWTGAITGSVAMAFDNNLRPISQSVDAGSVITFSYDADNLLTHAGALNLNPDAQNGLLDGTSLGAVSVLDVETIAGVYTRVRVGGGPLTNANLMSNTGELAERHLQSVSQGVA